MTRSTTPWLVHLALSMAVSAVLVWPASAAHHEAEGEAHLVAPGAEVEKLAGGFQFTEGPTCDEYRGDVYFTDIPNSRIHKWSKGQISTWREDTGRANGLFFDRGGALVVCEGGNRRITRITLAGQVEVLVDAYDGKKLNSPNDLWVDPSGGVYFTDPRYGDAEGMEQDGMHVYYASRQGNLKRVADDLVKPNGVIGTPMAEKLWVADHGANQTWEYKIKLDGTLVDKKLFAPQGSDGLARDERGNLYLTGDDGISVYSPEGAKIATLAVPEKPTNMVFCGEDKKTLFITARTGFYSLRMNVAGQ